MQIVISKMFNKIAIHASEKLKNKQEFINFINSIKNICDDIYFTEEAKKYFNGENYKTVNYKTCYDIFIIFGGDGSILKVVQKIKNFDNVFLPIAAGTLGFMSEIPPSEIEKTFFSIKKEYYDIDFRMLLDIKIIKDKKIKNHFTALNEALITKRSSGKLVSLDVFIDENYLTNYKSDGLILATPTGSTAYSLSCGGPILYPKFKAMILTPVAPHSFTHKPLIITEEKKILIKTSIDNRNATNLNIDGQIEVKIKNEDVVEIKKSEKILKFLRLKNECFFNTIKRKLNWGNR